MLKKRYIKVYVYTPKSINMYVHTETKSTKQSYVSSGHWDTRSTRPLSTSGWPV